MATLAPRSANASASGNPTCPQPPMTTTSRPTWSGNFVTCIPPAGIAGLRGLGSTVGAQLRHVSGALPYRHAHPAHGLVIPLSPHADLPVTWHASSPFP